jgi:hypothetical protein
MKQVFLSLAIASLFVVPVARAAPAQTSPSSRAGQVPQATSQTRVVNAEFVSYDASKKVITIKDEKGKTSTAPHQGSAVREMNGMLLKAGDHLKLTCRDNAKGEHQAVTDIKLSKPSA